jgi:hypothetical protein
MGSSAEEKDGVRVRGGQCVYSSGAHCISKRSHMRLCVLICVCVCAQGGSRACKGARARASVCVRVCVCVYLRGFVVCVYVTKCV